jgi:uncharacterized membrane protein YfcA
LPPHLALATNKGQSVFGSGAALARFSSAAMVPLRRAGWTFPLAFIGSLAGAQMLLWVRPEVLRPVVLVLLLAAAVGVLLRSRVRGGRAPSAAIVGGWLGAHLTVRGGERVARWVVLCVVTALVLRLSLDALRG